MSIKLRDKKEIVLSFNKTLNKLIKNVKCLATTPTDVLNIERIESQLATYKSLMGVEAVIEKAGSMLLMYKQEIISRNVDFVFSADPYAECDKLNINPNDIMYLIELFKNIRTRAESISIEEKLAMAELFHDLYVSYLEYVVVS